MGEQFKVVWRREGYARKSKTYETRRGADHMIAVLSGTFEEAFPNRDPSEMQCCEMPEDFCTCRVDGGVQGKPVGEAWREYRERLPELVEGPSLLMREVGEWTPVNPAGEESKSNE